MRTARKGHVRGIVDGVLFSVVRLVLIFSSGVVVGWLYFAPEIRLIIYQPQVSVKPEPSAFLEARIR